MTSVQYGAFKYEYILDINTDADADIERDVASASYVWVNYNIEPH